MRNKGNRPVGRGRGSRRVQAFARSDLLLHRARPIYVGPGIAVFQTRTARQVEGGMISRGFTKGDAVSEAVYSDCEQYRYLLTRTWGPGPKALFVMLNPSTATEVQNDPTVERCERRACALGFGAFRVTNIFAFRATDPRVMRAVADPVGPANDDAIRESTGWADMIVCAWGNHGLHLDRGAAVTTLLRATGAPLHHLGLTGQGQPRHPLYVGYDQAPQSW